MKNFSHLLAAAALLTWAGASLAVNLDPNGRGQALIYPYYTVRSTDGNAFNTYFSIVNGSVDAKALRVRIREARNGREVAGFNLVLQPRDTWAGALVPADGSAALVTRDTSCASPEFAPGAQAGITRLGLSAAAFTGASADGLGESPDRLLEGYMEVLEMATTSNNTGRSCAEILAGSATAFYGPPSGELSGSLTLINVADGTEFGTDATALADLASAPYYRPAGDPYPDFNATQVDPVAVILWDRKIFRIPTPTPLQAVDTVLMASSLTNEIVLDKATRSATDWVVTLPTRRFHNLPVLSEPFVNAFRGAEATPTSIAVDLSFTPRDGPSVFLVVSCGGLCMPSNFNTDLRLTSAASVLSFRNDRTASGPGTSAVFGSPSAWIVALPNGDGRPTTAENGAAILGLRGNFPNSLRFTGFAISALDGVTTSLTSSLPGLPAIGFMARTLRNGNLSCASATCQGNYGAAYAHKARRSRVQ